MPNLWLGLGYRQGVTAADLAQAIEQILCDHGLHPSDISGLGTIDRKAQDLGILAVCQTYQWQLQVYTAAELAVVAVPHPATSIQTMIGTPSVAEAAALLAAGSASQLLIEKQIYRWASIALTIAVARAADRMS